MKRIIISIITAVVIAAIALLAASEYFLHFALSRPSKTYEISKQIEIIKADYPWTSQWMDSLWTYGVIRDTVITNADGLKLHAWYLPAQMPTQKTAVVVHGYKSNPIDMMPIGYMYHQAMGWNILLPDLESHAQSEGKWIQMGWNDAADVSLWIGVAHNVFESDTMVVHGISMGAATTMCVAGNERRSYVRAYVEDCGYTSVWDEFEGELKAQFGLPAFPLLHSTNIVCKLQRGWSFKEASPMNQVAKCVRPMMFIHGDADTYVPTAMVHPLYEAHPSSDKELWLAKGSAHADSYKDHHEEYTRRVKAFLNKHI